MFKTEELNGAPEKTNEETAALRQKGMTDLLHSPPHNLVSEYFQICFYSPQILEDSAYLEAEERQVRM